MFLFLLYFYKLFLPAVQQLTFQTGVPVNHPEHRRRADGRAVWETAVRPEPVGVSSRATPIRYKSSFISQPDKTKSNTSDFDFWECGGNDGRFIRWLNRYEDFLIGLIRSLLGGSAIPLIRPWVCVVCAELISSTRGCGNCVYWS